MSIVFLPNRASAPIYAPEIAPDCIELEGYFTAGDRGGALYKQVGSEPSHAGKFHITLDDGLTVVWYEIAETILTERMFGAPCDGAFEASSAVGVDATSAIQNWLNCPISKHKRFTGISRVVNTVYAPDDIELEGSGYEVGLTAKQASSLSGTSVLAVHGATPAQIANLASNVSYGTRTISLLTTSGLREGDWICIYNPTPGSYNPKRDAYRAGEWCRIQRVFSSTVLHLYEPLFASYNADDVDVYLMRNGSPRLSRFTVEGPFIDNKACIDVDKVLYPWVEDVKTYGTQHSGIWVQRAIEPYIHNRAGFQTYDLTPDNEYDLNLAGVHGGEIYGSYYAKRHGIAMGASYTPCDVPNTRVKIFADTQCNDWSASLDVGGHGNSRFCSVIGGTHAGLVTGGESNRAIGSLFRVAVPSVGTLPDSYPLWGGEFVGGDFVYEGCTFEAISGANGYPIDFALSLGAAKPINFFFNNCIFKFHNSAPVLIRVLFQADSTTPEVNVYVNGGKIIGGAGLTQVVRVTRTGGASTVGAVAVAGLEGLNATALRNLVVNSGVGVAVGKVSGPPISLSKPYDPPTIAAGTSVTEIISTTGLQLNSGWRVEPSFSLSLGGLVATAYVSGSTSVTVVLFNPTTSAINLSSGILSAVVRRD